MESKTQIIKEENEVMGIEFPGIKATNLVAHAYSTKKGGHSKGCFAQMNLGLNRGDEPDRVRANYETFCQAFGFDEKALVLSEQVHDNRIAQVDSTMAQPIEGWLSGKRPAALGQVDGLVTDHPGLVLTTFYADCVPLFFLDPKKKVIGLAHAGWRGTVKGIGPKMVETMVSVYGCQREDILVGIGPSIGPCCYEVGESVKNEFEKFLNHDIIGQIVSKGRVSEAGQHYMLDLWQANQCLLEQVGVPTHHIEVTDLCTLCEQDSFFSHRDMGPERGSQVAMMMLK